MVPRIVADQKGYRTMRRIDAAVLRKSEPQAEPRPRPQIPLSRTEPVARRAAIATWIGASLVLWGGLFWLLRVLL